MPTNGVVVSLSVDRDHRFSKPAVERAAFIAGVGIEGDAHSDVSALGVGAIIELGDEVILAVTGRRNPCGQVNDLGTGLQRRLQKGHQGRVDGGAMAVVVHGGVVEVGAPAAVTAPTRHRPLQRV